MGSAFNPLHRSSFGGFGMVNTEGFILVDAQSRREYLKSKKTWSTDIKSNFLLVNMGSNLLLGVFYSLF